MRTPPLLARLLLDWLAPGNEALRGDLDEEFASGRSRGVSDGTITYSRGVDWKPMPSTTTGVDADVQPKAGLTRVMVIDGAALTEKAFESVSGHPATVEMRS